MEGNFWEKVEKFKLPIGLCILGLVLIIGGIFTSALNKKVRDYPRESLVGSTKIISVDVSGAVNKPGVYQLKDGSRIEDAIKTAGGFSKNSNQEYISKYLNMAQKLSDGSKIYVSYEGETVSGSATGSVAGVSVQTKVNINTASQTELEALPGIGPVTASKIISDRLYGSVDELLTKKVVSKAVFEKIKDAIVAY